MRMMVNSCAQSSSAEQQRWLMLLGFDDMKRLSQETLSDGACLQGGRKPKLWVSLSSYRILTWSFGIDCDS